jgi:2-oxoisovalerate dehydrogenase E1 component
VVLKIPRRQRARVHPQAGEFGSQFTPAAGWAQALQYRVRELKESEIVGSIMVVFGGDGAVATNGFWSSLTMATTLGLPLLFVVEDNGYAISVKGPLQTPGGNIAANLAAFQNLRVWDGSGTNPAETAELICSAVEYVRRWEGPGLLRLTVPRLSGHSSVDNQAYKSKQELEEEWQNDPLRAIHDYLVPALLSDAEWHALVADARRAVSEARDRALAQPRPDPATVTRFAFSEPGQPQQVGGLLPEGIELPKGTDIPSQDDPRRINMLDAIRRTLDVELTVNPRCVVFGEDVGLKGGVHAATLDLQAKYGENRVFDTSLSEDGIVGRAVGMALAGLMPAPEIQFRKYADPATEQINNTARCAGAPAIRSLRRWCCGFGGYRKIRTLAQRHQRDRLRPRAGWLVAFPRTRRTPSAPTRGSTRQ